MNPYYKGDSLDWFTQYGIGRSTMVGCMLERLRSRFAAQSTVLDASAVPGFPRRSAVHIGGPRKLCSDVRRRMQQQWPSTVMDPQEEAKADKLLPRTGRCRSLWGRGFPSHLLLSGNSPLQTHPEAGLLVFSRFNQPDKED